MYKVKFRYFRLTTVAVEKAINITYSEFVLVDLSIQHAIPMSHIVLWPVCHEIFFHIIS